jgi:hypothetical protein
MACFLSFMEARGKQIKQGHESKIILEEGDQIKEREDGE